MKKTLSVLVLSALVLSSCGAVRDSRLNPMNWFGRSTSEPVVQQGEVNPLIPRRRSSIFRAEKESAYGGWLVAEVSELTVERRPGGAIIHATGVADYQGPYDLKLVKLDSETGEGVLTYELKAYQPLGGVGSEWSRTVSAAVWLTDNDLAGIGTIRVKGARNIRTARR